MIRLEQTEDEYLVAIPPEQRERAKRIRPRHWDHERLRWVYPRELKIYGALVAEFAEDAAVVDITRPGSSAKPDIKAENESLRNQMVEIRRSLDLIAQNNGQNTKNQSEQLEETLANREQIIGQLRAELTETQIKLEQSEIQLADVISQLEHLEKRLADSQSEQSFNAQLKQRALAATGGDHKFRLLLDRVNVDKGLPLDITRAMEAEFRHLLGFDDPGTNIYDLIREASEANAMPLDAVDLAHLIRKQRNIIAHHDIHQNTYQAREILCLFAASLLWPEFPE